MSHHASTAMQQAATSVPTHRAPDPDTPFRRPSDDPTLGDGAKPATTLGWLPTLSLTDRRALEAPAYVYDDGDSGLGARVASVLEGLERPVDTIAAAHPGRLAQPATPRPHPLVVHIATAPALDPATAASVDATLRAYGSGATIVLSVDLGDRRQDAPDEDRARIEALVARSDVVLVSTRDAEWLYPDAEHHAIARQWLSSGPGIVIVTSAEGAWAANAVGATAAGTRGAGGDGGTGGAFVAGVIDAMWKGALLGVESRPDLRTLVWWSLHELIDHAGATTAIAAGSGAPTRAQLESERGIAQLAKSGGS